MRVLTQLRLELIRVHPPVQLYWLDVYSKHLHLLQYRRGHNIVCCPLFVQHLVDIMYIYFRAPNVQPANAVL